MVFRTFSSEGRMAGSFKKIPVLFAVFLIAGSLWGQQKCTLKGKITDESSNEPLAFSTIFIQGIELGTAASIDGIYSIANIPSGKYKVRYQMMGYQAKELDVDLQPGDVKTLDVALAAQNLALDEVTVVAKENQNSMSSSSKIEAQAIEHVQATSLGDVLQLLPGQVMKNSDLNNGSQATLRISSGDVAEDKNSAMGTAVILDGAPVSNNANLQVTNTATLGAEGYFETVSGGGVDLRSIPADNIESVEVIKGIPSVKHGDLTSGAILVNTKSGEMPFSGSVKYNATSVVCHAGKGFRIAQKGGIMNADIDYANAQSDLRTPAPSYTRITGSFAYANMFFDNRWKTNTKLSLIRTFDMDVNDKDAVSGEKRFSEDKGLRFTSNGKLNFANVLLRNVEYNFSVNYEEQLSYTKQVYTSSVQPKDTLLIDTTAEVGFLPAEYMGATYIQGKPMNLYGSISDNVLFKTGKLQHKLMGGGEWRTDANYGKGRYFGKGYTPPPSMRPRDYSKIPAVNQLSLYAEDLVTTQVLKRELKVQAGLRFDNIQPQGVWKGKFGQVLLPRMNLTYDLTKQLTLRGGYGLSSKAPSLIYLYPDKAYESAVSFQQYSSTYPNESLAVITTKVFEQNNKDLKPAIMKKYEIGMDGEYKKNTLNLNFYNEKLENGYSFKDVLAITPYPSYSVLFYIPGKGKQPILDKVNVDTLIMRDTYKKPVNNKTYITKGIEFTFNSAKIPVIGTILNVNGSYTVANSKDNSYDITINSQYYSGNTDKLIGIYKSNGYRTRMLLTTFRFIQHIPRVRFVASFALQVSWFEEYKTYVNNQVPVGYVTQQGETVMITPEQATSDYSFLIKQLDETAFMVEKKPALWDMNFRLTKEIGKNMNFSFYANNMLMHNPAYASRKSGDIVKRNPDLSFGGELSFKF